ncbi:uncharacterized protein [Hemitrygon akajei]|uniref:uncharacterized protein n=1 Tax=Hemitrygon akajei TaxID=2704970 RepID=UPI003BF9B602
MAKSEMSMKRQLVKPDSPSPSGAKPYVSYVELHFKSHSVPQVRSNGDGLTSPYSELNIRKDEPLIDEDENPPIASGPGGLPTTPQTAAQERKSKVKIGNRRHRLICLLCLVTSALIVIVVGLSIHISQIPQSQFTSDRNYHELNSTLQSKLSALNSNLSDLKRMHSDLRHQFTEMETKYRSVNETKAQISVHLEFAGVGLTVYSSRVSSDNGRFQLRDAVSPEQDGRRQDLRECEVRENGPRVSFQRNVKPNLLYTVNDRKSTCTRCKAYRWTYNCSDGHYFICEKSAPLSLVVLEKMLELCQEPVGAL